MVTTQKVLVRVLRLAFVLALVAATSSAVYAATAAWDPNPEPNIAGYKLSYGTQSGVHGTTIDVGKVTTFQFNPPPGQRYYVVVQAYTTTGELSPKSAEAVVDIPALSGVVNSAPTLMQPPDQNSKVKSKVSLPLVASDPDGTPLSYSATGLPQGLSLGATSGIIEGTLVKKGSHSVTVAVSDGALSASRSFKWTVSDGEAGTTNSAPSLNNVADQKSKLNASVSLQLRGSDPDGTPLTYSSSGLPPGLSLNAASGLISGVASREGSYQVTVTVSDGELSASRSFKWTVSASNGRNVASDATGDANKDDAGVRFQTAGRLSGVTALQDGRLLLIENDRSLSMLVPGSSAAQSILDAGDQRNVLTEVAVNTRFLETRHVFVGVITHLDAETSEFSVVRYREVQGSLGEGAAVGAALRYRGTGVPRFTVDDEERLYVAMPQTERSDAYSASILRFNADGSVPRENRVASPVFARGFSQPSGLGWDGPVLVATGADPQWSHAAAQLNPDVPSGNWPHPLEPMSVGRSASIIAAAFGVGTGDDSHGLRAFIDASGRLFRVAPEAAGGQREFDEVPMPPDVAPVSVAAGFNGQIYVTVRSETGLFWLLELASGQ